MVLVQDVPLSCINLLQHWRQQQLEADIPHETVDVLTSLLKAQDAIC